ncbi:MAG: hypothetical protein KKH12_04790 [Gammaproteobacteria bacterium]|nr:hypothetical protein [Gammaproteobacteria bacterium]MBU1480977.1 hypothetical protein [Gammaproteobacteria bacterium]
MYHIIGQISYPVFIACVFIFFILASIFAFIVGIGLATRNARMLRFFDFMNTRVSTRKLTKPLTAPHFIEPVLLKRPATLGIGIMLGAIVAILLLKEYDSIVFQPIYSDIFSIETADILAEYTRAFLLIGNGLCIGLGALLLYAPEKLQVIGRYTDKWLTFRKSTRPLNTTVFDVDKWVLSNSMVAGAALSVLSLGLGIWMYMSL